MDGVFLVKTRCLFSQLREKDTWLDDAVLEVFFVFVFFFFGGGGFCFPRSASKVVQNSIDEASSDGFESLCAVK